MGLFDGLVKSLSNLAKAEATDKIKENIKSVIQNGEVNANTSSSNISQGKSIPEEYSHFPVFESEIGEVRVKNEEKYKRCTMKYYNATDEEVDAYRDKIEEAGYKKMTNVRYEKDNEYIIVDTDKSPMEVVFHVKF